MTYAQPVIARSFFKNRGLALAGLFALVGCSDAGDASADTDDADPIATTTGAGADVTGSNDGGVTTAADDSSGEPPATAAGHCDYTSPFTQAAECREYTGSGWTGDEVQTACDQLMGAATLDALCSDTGMLGRCVLDGGTDREVRIVSYGDDPGSCASSQTGCETFGGGTWEPEGVCSDAEPVDTTGGGGVSSPFVQPTLECRDPIDGEPAGNGPDGQVCTWQLISASTEEGRHYEDYADCDIVYTQRPYYPVAGNDLNEGDMRMEDAAYTAELDWVREQIEASACVCCHSDVAPAGASNWTIDAPGNWIGTFDDSGLAFSAGWIDSSSFGMFSPEDNNGFDRTYGIPSTDPERMRDFFIAELDNRGLIEADFADDAPFGGPLYSQLIYEPSACENGEGVAADGTVNWEGGAARYVYVLEAGSGNPTVPPNLDLPDGTLWRIDVPSDEEDALQSGAVTYGDVPAIANQRVPAEGGPAALVEGEQYYLYVLADVVIPVTRCVFTY